MTAAESPAGLLRRAAARLRDDASRAAKGPWRAEQGSDEAPGIGAYEWWDVHAADGVAVNVGAWPVAQGNAEWIAMMGPQIAEPLADWLDAAAGYCKAGQWAPTSVVHDGPVAVARALLGE